MWFSWVGRSGASFLAGQVLLLERDLQSKYSCLAASELAEASFFGRSSCWLEFPLKDESTGEEEDPTEAISFVRMGRFQEGKSEEDPSSSPKGCAAQWGVVWEYFQWS